MTVQEYNHDFLPRIEQAREFVRLFESCIDHMDDALVDKDEVRRQFEIRSWSEETMQTILTALSYYKEHEGLNKLEGEQFMKHTMELVWHSCTSYLPKEDYNPGLYVTDGKEVFPVIWRRDKDGWQRFSAGKWYIEPGVNSDGYWWADLVQTINGFAPIQKGSVDS